MSESTASPLGLVQKRLQEFFRLESAGGLLLMGISVLALLVCKFSTFRCLFGVSRTTGSRASWCARDCETVAPLDQRRLDGDFLLFDWP